MINKSNFILLLALMVFTTGCFGKVSYKLYDEYSDLSPKVIYIAPVKWMAGGDSVSRDSAVKFLESLIAEQVKLFGYTIVDSKDGADAYLETSVTHWKEKLFPTYGALKIGFSFKMISTTEIDGSKNSPVIWKAKFKSKDFDMKFDTKQMEMGIIKAFEPRLERAVDTSFSTLPEAKFSKVEETFFDWLP